MADMNFQRHAMLGLLIVLIVTASTQVASSSSEGLFASLLSFIRRSKEARAVDAIVSEAHGARLLGPLWRSGELNLPLSSESRGLKQLLGDELSVGSDPDPDPQPNPARRPLRNEDFIYAAPSTLQRFQLAQASRYWRKGMRAVFVLDNPRDRLSAEALAGASRFRESFAWFPSYRRMPNDKRDHYLEGDRRAAMTPILAYATLANTSTMSPWTTPALDADLRVDTTSQMWADRGSESPSGWSQPSAPPSTSSGSDPFLWMLSGDDDTIFFMRGVKALLRDYDAQLPYFITDSMYVGSKSPQPGAWEFRCYPCHLPWGRWRHSAARRLLTRAGENSGSLMKDSKEVGDGARPNRCGCSVEELCKKRFPRNASLCQNDWEGPVPFGGVGFIFSIGFFKALAAAKGGNGLRAYEACIGDPETSVMAFPEGGDAFMSRCMWRLGFPITDPGYTPLGRYMGEVLQLKNFYEAPLNLSDGQLPTHVETRWATAVSMHLGARQQRSFRAAAMTVKYISGVYDLVAELLWPTGQNTTN